MSTAPVIRRATEADAAAILEIYRPFVESTAVSFETVVPSIEELTARICESLTGWQWLVAESEGEIAGYAYGSRHRQRAAYRWSVEVSAYVATRFRQRGVGRALYDRLLGDLTALGYCMAYAGITLPNDASIGFHRSFGFEPIGTFERAGWKFGRWHDVAWLQRRLRDLPPSH